MLPASTTADAAMLARASERIETTVRLVRDGRSHDARNALQAAYLAAETLADPSSRECALAICRALNAVLETP